MAIAEQLGGPKASCRDLIDNLPETVLGRDRRRAGEVLVGFSVLLCFNNQGGNQMKKQISGTEQSKEDSRASPEKNPDPPVAAVVLFRQRSPGLLDAAGRGSEEELEE